MAELEQSASISTEKVNTPERTIESDHSPTEKLKSLWDRVKSQRIPEEVDFEVHSLFRNCYKAIEDRFLLKVRHKQSPLILADYEKHAGVSIKGEQVHTHFVVDLLNLCPEGDERTAYNRISVNPHIRHVLNCPSLQALIAALMGTIEEEQGTLNTITSYLEHNVCDQDTKALIHVLTCLLPIGIRASPERVHHATAQDTDGCCICHKTCLTSGTQAGETGKAHPEEIGSQCN